MGLHVGLVGNAKSEEAARKGRFASGGQEKDKTVSSIYHNTVLPGKIRQAVCQTTDREGGGCFLPYDQLTKTRKLVADVFWEKYPDMRVPPVENPMCTSFKEYGEVTETVPLDFTEHDVT